MKYNVINASMLHLGCLQSKRNNIATLEEKRGDGQERFPEEVINTAVFSFS